MIPLIRLSLASPLLSRPCSAIRIPMASPIRASSQPATIRLRVRISSRPSPLSSLLPRSRRPSPSLPAPSSSRALISTVAISSSLFMTSLNHACVWLRLHRLLWSFLPHSITTESKSRLSTLSTWFTSTPTVRQSPSRLRLCRRSAFHSAPKPMQFHSGPRRLLAQWRFAIQPITPSTARLTSVRQWGGPLPIPEFPLSYRHLEIRSEQRLKCRKKDLPASKDLWVPI